MSELPFTAVIAALLAILMLPLTLQISIRRASLGQASGDLTAVVFGDGDDLVLRRRIRALGNFIEYAPFCLVLLGLMEMAGAGNSLSWIVGGLLLGGRVLHAIGMLYFNSPMPRAIAMLMTYASFLIPAVWLLRHAWA